MCLLALGGVRKPLVLHLHSALGCAVFRDSGGSLLKEDQELWVPGLTALLHFAGLPSRAPGKTKPAHFFSPGNSKILFSNATE